MRQVLGSEAGSSRAVALALLASVALAIAVRVPLFTSQGLWADEVFSLAMATGHSLEHPAASADPTRGDFVEPSEAMPPSHFRQYVEHESPAVSPVRVVRAVRLSDTSPPLYYVALWAWTLATGTGDAALRSFSTLWSVASLPLMYLAGRRMSGRGAGLAAAFLLAVSPMSAFYGTEGRMYAMLLFFVLASAVLTLRAARVGEDEPSENVGEGPRSLRVGTLALWVLTAVAGFMTHYFFVFAWLPITAWLVVIGPVSRAGRPARRTVYGRERLAAVAATALVGLIVLPWYIQLPAILGTWRLTEGWLKVDVSGYHPVTALLRLAWGYLSPVRLWPPLRYREIAALILLSVPMIAALCWGTWRWLLTRPALLAWLWLGGALGGPIAYDVISGNHTGAYPRYAATGLPAALLLLGAVIGRLPRTAAVTATVAIMISWIPGLRAIYTEPSRANEPFRQVAGLLDREATAGDVVIVHSIPSGVIGLARYMDNKDARLASWVNNLGLRRLPDDMWSLAAGQRRLLVVSVHSVLQPLVQQDWLNANAEQKASHTLESARVWVYCPRGKSEYFATGPPPEQPMALEAEAALAPSDEATDAQHLAGGRSPRERLNRTFAPRMDKR